jgi:nicotinamidase-related amidase
MSKAALLIVDMQNDLVKDEEGPFALVAKSVREAGVIEKTEKLLKAAREAGLPIFHIKTIHRADGADVWTGGITNLMSALDPELIKKMRTRLVEGTRGAEFIDELKPVPGEFVVEKRRSDAFYQTPLELFLRRLGVDILIIAGVITSGCVEATARGARDRDFNVIIVGDCCADMNKEAHELSLKLVFPSIGRVRSSEQIIRAMSESKIL